MSSKERWFLLACGTVFAVALGFFFTSHFRFVGVLVNLAVTTARGEGVVQVVTASLGPQVLLLLLPFVGWTARRRPLPGSLTETWLLLGALVVACGWFAWFSRQSVDDALSLHAHGGWAEFPSSIVEPTILTAAAFVVLLLPMVFAHRTSLALICVAPLMVLLAGLGAYAFELENVFPPGTVCGPGSTSFIASMGEVHTRGLVVWSAVVGTACLLGLSLAGGLFLRSSPTTGGLRPRVLALGIALLAASALLVGEAHPFSVEAQLPPLPVQDNPWPLPVDRIPLPSERGPSSLRMDGFLLQLEPGRSVIRYRFGEPDRAVRAADLAETMTHFQQADANRRGPQSTVVLLASPALPSSEFSAALRHLPTWIESVQLAFDQPQLVHRPLLGTLRIINETGLELPLRPVDGSRPLHLRADETWGAFCRRALDEHGKGPVHLVLSD